MKASSLPRVAVAELSRNNSVLRPVPRLTGVLSAFLFALAAAAGTPRWVGRQPAAEQTTAVTGPT
jgi:hypothetical protein